EKNYPNRITGNEIFWWTSTTLKTSLTSPTQAYNLPNYPVQSNTVSTDSISQGISTGYNIYKTLVFIVAPIIVLILLGIFLWFYCRGRGKAKDRNNLDGIEGVGYSYTAH
ncbi:19314_t:CDS:2, partial [Dentiscutata erythropus]